MGRRIAAFLLCACCFLCLTACSDTPAPPPPQSPVATAGADGSAEQKPSIPQPQPDNGLTSGAEDDIPSSPGPSTPLSDQEISLRYKEAITALESAITLNVTGREWQYGPENDLKNLYYKVLSQNPELKYAYDMTAEVSDGTAECTFLYMPYKTGAYAGGPPAGSHTVSSLHDADVMAQSMIDGKECLSIAISDPALEVEDLQRAVGQGGYGWIVCSLSRDGTELLASPHVGITLSDCAENINETFRLANGILEELITEDMTDREKAEAAYAYITENVAYDFRYYSGKNDMPFESTVALGALRDNLAICGGYSHALETLLDLCGIENYTVSGVSKGEYHAWNYVVLDGEGYYCDPTADRGNMRNHFLLTQQELEALGGYEWDAEFYSRLRR